MADLKICPFCGRTPRIKTHRQSYFGIEPYVVRLCGVQTKSFQTVEEAVEFWNRGTTMTEKDLLIQEQRQEIERLKAELEAAVADLRRLLASLVGRSK